MRLLCPQNKWIEERDWTGTAAASPWFVVRPSGRIFVPMDYTHLAQMDGEIPSPPPGLHRRKTEEMEQGKGWKRRIRVVLLCSAIN